MPIDFKKRLARINEAFKETEENIDYLTSNLLLSHIQGTVRKKFLKEKAELIKKRNELIREYSRLWDAGPFDTEYRLGE